MSSFGFSVNKVPYKIEKTYELIFKESRVSSDQEISIPKIGDFSDLGFCSRDSGFYRPGDFQILEFFGSGDFQILIFLAGGLRVFISRIWNFSDLGIAIPEIGNFSDLEIFFVSLDIPTKSFLY